MKKVPFIIAIILIFSQSFAAEFTIPASRRITWQGYAGVDGGIPTNYTKYGSTIQTVDQGDDTSAIQTALNAASTSQYVELGSGTFTISSTLTIPTGVLLKGQGMQSTQLQFSGSAHISMGASSFSYWDSVGGCEAGGSCSMPNNDLSWTAHYTKGDTTITVSDGSGISVGDTIVLTVVNDNSTLVFDTLNAKQTQGIYGGIRAMSQAGEVISKSVNDITIDPPLYYDYPSGQTPKAYYGTPNIGSGMEDLTVLGAGTSYNYNIDVHECRDCWIQGVESSYPVRAHIKVQKTTKSSFTKNYLHHGQAYQSQSYGFEIGDDASALYIYNNIFYYGVTGLVTYEGMSGSVIAYNYFKNCAYSLQTTWLTGALGMHGAHPHFNLFEGNIGWSFTADNWFGSSSHNTLFRNRFIGYQTNPPDTYTKQYNSWAFQGKKYSYNYNIIGNVLGHSTFHTQYEFQSSSTCSPQGGIYESGSDGNCANGVTNDASVHSTELRHANYDYVNDSKVDCDDAGEPGCQSATNYNYPTDTLPDSLYLASKPSWLGSLSYPTIDPATPTINDNAAKYAFDNISAGVPQWPDGVPSLSSITVASNGTTVTIVADQALTQGAGYNDTDLDIDCSVTGDNIGMTYVSGDGTTTLVYTAASTIQSSATGETCNLDFNGDANSLENGSGTDLPAIVSQSVNNGSSQGYTFTHSVGPGTVHSIGPGTINVCSP